MIVKNEEALLPQLLDKVIPWVDELVVVDTGSEDSTPEIVESYGGNLIHKPLTDSFSTVRNLGLESATGDWILMLDADEEPTKALLDYIRTFVETASPSTRALLVCRENRIDGELLGSRGRELHLRVFRRGDFVYKGTLHEQPVPTYQGSLVHRVAPPKLILKHYKTHERQEQNNQFYRDFAERLGDKRLIRLQGGDPKTPSGHAAPPQFSEDRARPLRLNLGSGSGRMAGFYNVDINSDFKPDFLCDLNQGLPFPDDSVDEIYAAHVIEHFSYHRVSWVLADWIRALKSGGKLTIRCPDFEWVCRSYISGEVGYLRAIQLLYGGQTIKDFDTHYTALDFQWLLGQLTYHGCKDIKRRDDLRKGIPLRPEEELVVTAVKK